MPISPNSAVVGIAQSSDGSVWFTEITANAVGHYVPGDVVHEFKLPAPDRYPRGITVDRSGNAWFTEEKLNQIGRLSPSGALTEYPIPTPSAGPWAITTGADGTIWFNEIQPPHPHIARISGSGAVSEYAVSASTDYLAPAPDGSVWFTEPSIKIGRVSSTGQVTEFPVPPGISVGSATACDGAGNLWYSEDLPSGNNSSLHRVTLTGQFDTFPLGAPRGIPYLTSGPAGSVWFAESTLGRIGKVSMSHDITEYPLPWTAATPLELADDGQGGLWIHMVHAGDKLAHFVPPK